jgi:transposase-like protein
VANRELWERLDAQVARHRAELKTFDAKWGERYPMIGESWRRNWEHIIPFLATPLSSHTGIPRTVTGDKTERSQTTRPTVNRGVSPSPIRGPFRQDRTTRPTLPNQSLT